MKITVYLSFFQLSLPPMLWPMFTAWGIRLHLSLCSCKITANNNSKILTQCLLQSRHFFFTIWSTLVCLILTTTLKEVLESSLAVQKVQKDSTFHAEVAGLTSGQGAKIPCALGPKTNKQTNIKRKQKQYCNKFNEDFFKKGNTSVILSLRMKQLRSKIYKIFKHINKYLDTNKGGFSVI